MFEYLNYEIEDCSNKIESSALETKLNILESKIRYRESDWCEYGEKLPKFFLNLEKNRAVQNQIRTIFYSEKELMKNLSKEINPELLKFNKALFEAKTNVSKALIQNYLNCILRPRN